MFSRSEFAVCESQFVNFTDVSAENKSLRQLTNLQSTSGGQLFKIAIVKQNAETKNGLQSGKYFM